MKMIKKTMMGLVSMAAVVAMTACSSDGGDGGGGGGSSSLATGGFVKEVEKVTTTSVNVPFFTSIQKSQFLILASDVEGSGNIESISFRAAGAEVQTECLGMTVQMGHTSLADLTNTYADNVEEGKGSLQTVMEGDLTILALDAGDQFTIDLDTAFSYNGVDNLVLYFSVPQGCSNVVNIDTNTLRPNSLLHNSTDINATTGSVYAYTPNLVMNFAGGVNAQEFVDGPSGDSTVLGGNYRVQVINLAEDINGSGPITGLAYQLDATTSASEHNLTIKLGHTTLDSFTIGGTFEENYAGASVTVAENVLLKIPAGLNAGDWFWIPLSESFNYNGTDNLIVDVQGLTVATNPVVVKMFTPPNDRLTYSMDGTQASPDGVFPGHHNIKLRFNGAPMSVVETNLMAYGVPLNSGGSGAIAIYGSHVLGTGAALNSISLRVAQDIAADVTYTDANITIGHTTLTDLDITLAANMDDATVVYNGDITIPAGTKAGDWITVPVSGFTYDPTKNLTVQMYPGTSANDTLVYYGGNGVVSNVGAMTPGSATIDLGTEGSRHPHLQLGFTK